jgi:hypothetical protein
VSRRARNIVFSILTGIIVLAGLAGVLGAIQGDPAVRTIRGSTTTTSTTLPSVRSLGEVGRALDELIGYGHVATYHAIYDVKDSKLPEGLIETLEVWRKDGRFRSDLVDRASDGTKRNTNIDDGTTRRACTTANGTQTCQITEVPPIDFAVYFVQRLADAKTKPRLTTSVVPDIAGYQASCFEAEGFGELCLTSDGVLLKMSLETAVVTATRLDTDVPASAFDVTG